MIFHKFLLNETDLYNIFTKKEEYDAEIVDIHDRYPYCMSNYKEIFRPVVSEYLYNNNIFKPAWPSNYAYAMCLTHDVDHIFDIKFKKTYHLVYPFLVFLKNLSYKFSKLSFVNLSSIKLWRNIFKIIEIEENFEVKSSFYFLSSYSVNKEYSYNIKDIKQEIRQIADSGWEIGLHGGYKSYISLGILKEEKRRLEDVISKEIVGYRNHYLKFKTPKTWELLDKAGFLYDTTFGYAECVGFRNGIAYPFRPYNVRTGRIINILEIPLVIMDATLFNYMKLSPKTSWIIIKKLIDNTKKVKGVITILWHNSYMNGEYEYLYRKIIEYGKETLGWLSSCKEIYEWWVNNVERQFNYQI